LGLFAYPVLMAADILIYGSDLVPVGRDQIQHLEFCRDWATKFNVAYVPGYDAADPHGEKGSPPGVFKLPEAFVRDETAVLLGVDGQKMSKSYGNTIELFGDEREVKKKIMSIKTDASPVEAPKPVENSALFELLKVMAPQGEWPGIEKSWNEGGVGYGAYKKKLVDYFHLCFDEPRKRFCQWMGDKVELERVLMKGAEQARACAMPIVQKMRAAVGISRR
jgi:tryptophanyl-tRNA synthetase